MELNAAVQVDVDGLWTIYRYHGIEREIWPDPVYTEAIPRFLELFHEQQIKATFFIVGVDTTIPEKREIIRQISSEGHEIANHSYHHKVPFEGLKSENIEKEIVTADIEIKTITGQKIEGFRAPAYGFCPEILPVLKKLGYRYDATIFPTRWSKLLQKIEKKRSGTYTPLGTYGGNKYKNVALKPYLLNHKDPAKSVYDTIYEIPVSVIPMVRTPMHRSVTQFLGLWYFSTGIRLNKLFHNPLSVLFHGVELVDRFQDEKIPEMKWVSSPFPQRIDEIRLMIKLIKRKYKPVKTCQLIPTL